MQATLEAETKGKAEALRVKKKLESHINDLEIALGKQPASLLAFVEPRRVPPRSRQQGGR